MLRITNFSEASVMRLVIEGRLVGPWVVELRKCWETGRVGKEHTMVDLAGVTFIDSRGKALLTEMVLQGAQLLATGLLTQSVVEDIQNSIGRNTQ